MYLKILLSELRRQLLEAWRYKVNLFFANLTMLVMVAGYLSYFHTTSKLFDTFIVLFCWYLATHSITHPAFFLEDEVVDRTIVTVVNTQSSVLVVLIQRIVVQIIFDLIKAIPLFVIIGLIVHLSLPAHAPLVLLIVLFTVVGLYGLGIGIGSFTLISHRTSNIAGLISYFLLFFGGVLDAASINSPFVWLMPFRWLQVFTGSLDWYYLILIGIQCACYWFLGIAIFKFLFRRALQKGSLFYV